MAAASLSALCARALPTRPLASIAVRRARPSSSPTLPSFPGLHQRTYVTRAHAAPTISTPIAEALSSVLTNVTSRRATRAARWDSNREDRIAARATYLAQRGGMDGIEDMDAILAKVKEDAETKPYKNMDETIELAVQLNLDPRKPGQALRGSVSLPHGNGKSFKVVLFTENEDIAKSALEAGAAAAGGAELIKSLLDGTVPVGNLDRTLASPDMMVTLTKTFPKAARLLGPRGLMPNPKLGTIVAEEELLENLGKQMSGTSTYRTDKAGVVHVGVGRGSFGTDKLMDNVRSLMNEIQDSKPEHFGKGKKNPKSGNKKGGGGSTKKTNAKYYLKAHLSSTQGKGSVQVDLRTIDPTSSFFMGDIIA